MNRPITRIERVIGVPPIEIAFTVGITMEAVMLMALAWLLFTTTEWLEQDTGLPHRQARWRRRRPHNKGVLVGHAVLLLILSHLVPEHNDIKGGDIRRWWRGGA